VKVDASHFMNKENVAPGGVNDGEREDAAKQGAQRWSQLQEEAAKVRQRQQEAREAAEAAEAAAREEEKRQHEAEQAAAAEKERLRREAQEAAEEAERQRQAAEIEAERQRQHEEATEAARRAAEEEKELKRAEQAAKSWCKDNGYVDWNTEKKTFKGGRKFALHTAVKHRNAEMVAMLVKCGAKKDSKDSKGQTPEQLAITLNKHGEVDAILAHLRC
jgi:hypothetical protein